MGAAKWIGGIIGFMAGGPLGALAGFVFGSLFDTDSSDAGSYYGEEPTHGTTYTGQRNSFLFSMLVMASYIIRADGTDTAQPLRTAQADGQTKPTGI